MLDISLPFLSLKERAVEELQQQQDFEVKYEELDKSALVYLKKCGKGKVTIDCKISKVILEESHNVELQIEKPLITGNIELIGCSGITLVLATEVPVITMDRCAGCTIRLFREDPLKAEFKLVTSHSKGITIEEAGSRHPVNHDDPELHMTRLISGQWLTEKIIHENGYQTTQREREFNLAREDRDGKKFGQAMLKGVKVSKKGPTAPSLPPSTFGDGITNFDWNRLNPTTTVERSVADMTGENRKPVVDSELTEYHDPPEVLQQKVAALAKMMKKAKYTVAFTGAGISQSAGLATYRGPNGVWTRRDQGLPPPKSASLNAVTPTEAHLTLVALMKRKLVRHVVSTNVDGLHRRSGISAKDLSELHGNCFKEVCKACGKEYLRDFDTTARGTRADHLTGRRCDACQKPLYDNIVNFGESLPEEEITKAVKHSQAGDLALVLGTSMKVSPACNIPEEIWKKPEGNMVIVNLQKTPYDKYSNLRIFGETDVVLSMLMEELEKL